MKNIISSKSLFILAIILLLCTHRLAICQPSPTIEWQHCLGGSGWDIPSQVLATRDGGYIIVGYSYSHDDDLHGAPPNAVNGWVVKLDEYGQIQWSRIVGGDNNNFLHSVIETSEGDFVVAGSTYTLYLGVTKTHGGAML